MGGTMSRKIVLGFLVVSVLCIGVFFYFNYFYSVSIKAILDDPRRYEGLSLTISGKVVDRASIVFLKYFKLQDGSAEIIVVTWRTLPALGSRTRIKGKVVEAFAIGGEQLLVFVEEDCSKRSWWQMAYSQCKNDAVRVKSLGLAAVLSLFWSGVGQIYNGRFLSGILWFGLATLNWLLTT
ncbi:MAG: hypothetical protein KGJ40_02080 [candidate division NC10 bacterium]|nr:hypothetical protein [candidate division NC10 bacterium]